LYFAMWLHKLGHKSFALPSICPFGFHCTRLEELQAGGSYTQWRNCVEQC
jgi:hypothetical protein